MHATAKRHSEPCASAGSQESTDGIRRNCRLASRLAGLFSVLTGVVVLAGGWACGIASLRSIVAGYPAIRPNTALCILLSGVALWLDGAVQTTVAVRILGQSCAGTSVVIGIMTLIGYLPGINLRIEGLLFPHMALAVAPGRVSVMAAVSFVLLGCTQLASRSRRGFAAGPYLVIGAGIISLLNLAGYVCGIGGFANRALGIESTAMALPTALSLVALCIGVLLSRPDWSITSLVTGRGPCGVIARRLLPAAILFPLLLGWLGWRGQLMGLYDTSFGLALVTCAHMVVFAFLILRIGERLRETESRYRTVLESLPHMVWTLQPEGSCDYLSPQWVEYTGIREAAQTGYGWMEQIHPDDRGRILESLRASVRQGSGLEAEYRIRGATGSYRWFRAVANPVGSGGRVQAWFGSSTDIHNIKLAEAALRASEESYRDLADAMPLMVWSVTPDGSGNYHNRRYDDYFGLATDQSMDSVWKSMLHPDDLMNCLEVRAAAINSGQPYAIEFRLMRASDQTWRWHLGRGGPCFNAEGRMTRWIGTCVDIEDYKQAAASILALNENLEERVWQRTAALARANAELYLTRTKLQSVLDAATQMSIIATDTKGIIQVFNSGAERMLQYQASEMVGRTPEILHDRTECAERSESLTREFGRSVNGFDVLAEYARRGVPDSREWTYVRKDGTRLDVCLAITPVSSREGVVEGFLGIATDITARKSLERELRLNIGKLVEQTRRAEQASAAKSEFLAAMSHEIRTPMNAILGMADMMWETQLDAAQIRYVEVFRRAGSNLLALINNILDVSKIEAGYFELERIEFDLEEVVDESLELFSLKARAKGIGLSSRLLPGVTTALMGDPNRLRQVLVNILGNALKFTESGAVSLAVRNHESGRNGEIEFAISDTGIGIPPDKLDTIFDDFTQGDASTTRQYGGTGLGLGISRRLVTMMNGSLTVSSLAGSGSTFRFSAVFEPAPESQREAPAALQDFSGRRVLVIDDNSTNRFILQETVNAWGFESAGFARPEEALANLAEVMAGTRPWSLVLLDDRMAVMDGFAAAAKIKRVAPDLPIVMLTSDSHAGDARRREQAGLAGYATKPVKRPELLRLVCAALHSRERRQPSPSGSAQQEPPLAVKALRILVVEDSPDNRLLVRVYIEGTPHRLTFAEDGKSGVDQFLMGNFDLVLMDMQMPIMDGLTATRAIRAIETERGTPPVPIIALTANARTEDVEVSRRAGCNAHLSKPISKLRLLNVINEHGRQPDAGGSGETGREEQIGIKLPPGLEEFVPGYLASRREDVQQMHGLLDASDFEGLAVLAHNIKGSGGSYGFPEISRIGATLEHSAKQQDPLASGAQLIELGSFLDRVHLTA